MWNTYFEWASCFLFALQAQSRPGQFLISALHIDGRYGKRVFLMCLFSYQYCVPCIRKERYSLLRISEFPMALSAGRGTRKLPPAATSNRLMSFCLYETQSGQSGCLWCTLCRTSPPQSAPCDVSPRCRWIQNIPTSHNVHHAIVVNVPAPVQMQSTALGGRYVRTYIYAYIIYILYIDRYILGICYIMSTVLKQQTNASGDHVGMTGIHWRIIASPTCS